MNWEDDPTEGLVHVQPKDKTVSVKDLQEQIELLEMRLQLAQPEHIAKLRESHREAQFCIRSLRYFLDGIERALTRMHARIAEVDVAHPDLETLASLLYQCRDRLSVNLFPEQEINEPQERHGRCDCERDVRGNGKRTSKRWNERARAEQLLLFGEEDDDGKSLGH